MSDLRDVVDENDEVVGVADKATIERDGLICRVAFILLLDGDDRLLLQQRKATKRFYPLYWSGAATGHLKSGESYEVGAHRELGEELGIDAELQLLGTFYSADDKEMVGVLAGRYDGPLTIEEMEVERVAAFTIDYLRRNPDGMLLTSFVERSLPLLDRLFRSEGSETHGSENKGDGFLQSIKDTDRR